MRRILLPFLAALLISVAALAGPPPIPQFIPSAPYLVNKLASQFTPTNNNVCWVGDSITFATLNQSGVGIAASGGTAPYTFAVSGLPSGGSTTTNSPDLFFQEGSAALGSYSITVTATDSASVTGSQPYTLTIATTGISLVTNGGGSGTLTMGSVINVKMSDSNRGGSQVVPFLSNRRVVTPQSLLFGHPGDTTSSLLARMAPIVAAPCGSYVVMIGTNDLGTISTTTLEANLQSIWAQLLTTGRPVVAMAITPRNLTPGATLDQLWVIDRWIRTQAGATPNLYIVDTSEAYGNSLSPTASPYSLAVSPLNSSYTTIDYSYSYDGLHPKSIGAFAAFTAIAALFEQLYPDLGYFVGGVSDLYSSTNTSGNLLSNAMMAFSPAATGTGAISGTTLTISGIPTGTWGIGTLVIGTNVPANEYITALGTGAGAAGTYTVSISASVSAEAMTAAQGTVSGLATGTAPDGWIATTLNGGCASCVYTAAVSQSTLSDGTPAVQFAVSGTVIGGYQTTVYLSQNLTAFTNFNVGDKLQASCRVQMSAGSEHITAPFITLTYNAGGVAYTLASGPAGLLVPEVNDAGPTTAYAGQIATPTPAPALPGGISGTLSVSVGVYLTNAGSVTVAGTFQIGACALRKVLT